MDEIEDVCHVVEDDIRDRASRLDFVLTCEFLCLCIESQRSCFHERYSLKSE